VDPAPPAQRHDQSAGHRGGHPGRRGVDTARGVNVNITLLFALGRYDQVIDAYMSGLEHRAAREQPLAHIASVASFFVSRVDTKADNELPPGSPLRGTVAVTNARLAYRLHQERFTSACWQRLAAKGARNQRPLWASTGTKNPDYSDVLYVDRLIAPGVVNTMLMATIEAYDHHGDPQSPPIPVEDADDDQAAAALRASGLDLDRITTALEREGIQSFTRSYDQLIACIQEKTKDPTQGAPSVHAAEPHSSNDHEHWRERGERTDGPALSAAVFSGRRYRVKGA
jgi:transaldolase